MIGSERKQITGLIKKEVILTIGCTEPIVVALCVAKVVEILGIEPGKIEVLLSVNILKDATGADILGADIVGLPIAVALGALIDRSKYQLEVLRDYTPEAVEQGKLFIAERRIYISLKEDVTEKLYIGVICAAGSQEVTAVIAGGHTTFAHIATDGKVLLDKQQTANKGKEDVSLELNLRRVYDFALISPLDKIRPILDTAHLNKAAAEQVFKGGYGYSLSKMLRGAYRHKVMGDSVLSHILSHTPAACDARVAGAMIPVVGNSGSGSQGISATLPAVVFAEENGKTEEELIRALMLSHLAAIYTKQSLGHLFVLCGCVVAATDFSYGITRLVGRNYNQAIFATQSMVANLMGIICDDAKPGCAFKATTGVSTAVSSAMMAMKDHCMASVEGIINGDVGQGIRSLTRINSQAINEMDKMVLDIMTHKGGC